MLDLVYNLAPRNRGTQRRKIANNLTRNASNLHCLCSRHGSVCMLGRQEYLVYAGTKDCTFICQVEETYASCCNKHSCVASSLAM